MARFRHFVRFDQLDLAGSIDKTVGSANSFERLRQSIATQGACHGFLTSADANPASGVIFSKKIS
jgi:hypothetical protein